MKKLFGVIVFVVTLTVLFSGYTLAQSGSNETSGNELLLKNVLRDSGTIRGFVHCPLSGPLPGATVYLEGLSFTAITGTSGEFTLLYVPAGSHRLVINYQGELNNYDVTVEENSTTSLGDVAVECAVPGGTPCNDSADCLSDEYCAKPDCTVDGGFCLSRPLECPTIYAPVCGCDQITYSNECEAAMAGVNFLTLDECVLP